MVNICNIPKTLVNSLSLMTITSGTSYLIKMIFASIISAHALISNSQEGVIGSMLISPFGGPVVGLAASLVNGSMKKSLRSLLYISLGIAIMFGIGYGIGLFYENEEPTYEMERRYIAPDLLTFISAIVIGIVFGLIALSTDGSISEAIGAGIAISLLPPVVNAGLTMTKTNISAPIKHQSIVNTLKIAGYNVVGILTACTVLFATKCYLPSIRF